MNCGSEMIHSHNSFIQRMTFWCFLEYSKNKTLEMRNASVSFRFALYWPRRTNELQLPREKRHKLVDSFLPIGIHLASERDLVKQHSNSRYTYIKLMITFLKKSGYQMYETFNNINLQSHLLRGWVIAIDFIHGFVVVWLVNIILY